MLLGSGVRFTQRNKHPPAFLVVASQKIRWLEVQAVDQKIKHLIGHCRKIRAHIARKKSTVINEQINRLLRQFERGVVFEQDRSLLRLSVLNLVELASYSFLCRFHPISTSVSTRRLVKNIFLKNSLFIGKDSPVEII